MKQYWVYMVRCRDGTFYTGVTGNIERRLAEHQQGTDPACYTFTRGPVRLAYAVVFDRPDEAIHWEKRLKGWSHAKKAALIRNDWDEIRRLAHRQRPSTSSG